jgi:putative hydroxymethylpyrimidine transport system permease protein
MGKRLKTWINNNGLFVFATVISLLIWEFIVVSNFVPSFILPAPSRIILALNQYKSVLLLEHLPATLKEVVLGLIISLIFGIALGIGMHFSKSIEKLVYPLLVISQTIPLIAISPIFILWFGYSIWSKVAVSFLIAFFPIVISTYDGLKSTSIEYKELLLTMGASRFEIFKKVQIPMALPSLLSGVKMAVVYSVVGATIGEWLGASEGLGYFSRRMSSNLEADALFAAIVILSLLGIFLYMLVSVIEKKLIKYKNY